jgi:tRNA uridine 5-carboxymethylaminomethyl modification enzyme
LKLTPQQLRKHGLTVNADGVARSAADLLRHPTISWAQITGVWPELGAVSREVAEQLEIDGRYSGYLDRQEAEIYAFRRDEELILPPDLDYSTVGSLSTEIRLKLDVARPANLGAASRISGVTPAALVALLRHVKRGEAAA